MNNGEGFLERWSRRKQADKVETPESGSEDVTVEPAATDSVPDARNDDEILAELGLPHPDDLKPGDDVRGFLQAAVPQRLRRLALRHLWRSHPIFASVDGLVEYGEDYTDSATVIENMQTVYQVGKGMWQDLATEAEDREGDGAPGDSEPAGTSAQPGDQDGEAEEVREPEPAAAPVPDEPESPDVMVTRRRMVFTIDG